MPHALHALAATELRLLHGENWFRDCAGPLQQQLLAIGQRVLLADGQMLFARGDSARGLCCVLAGTLRVGSVLADGRPSLLTALEPGQWFGEISLVDGLPRTHDVVADGAAEVWRVPGEELLNWLEAHPVCWRDIARLVCVKLRMSFEVLEDIAQLPLPQRLAKRLLLVARDQGVAIDAGRRPRIRLSQEQLALMLGVSRQTVNKALGSLAEQGMLALHYGEIELLDTQALAGGERQ